MYNDSKQFNFTLMSIKQFLYLSRKVSRRLQRFLSQSCCLPLIVNHCQNCQTPGKSTCGLDRHWKPFISRSNTNEHYLKSWIIYVYLFWQKLETNFESVWYQRTCTPLSKIFLVNNLRCAYCTTYYTVIAKAETFTEDLR